MQMSQDIYVVIEHIRGQVSDISYVMLAAAHDLAQSTGGKVVGVLLGSNAQELANSLAADRVLYGDSAALAEFTSDSYQKALTGLVRDNEPRAVLFGSTTIGADVAGGLAAQLEIPLVSSCITISDGKIVSKICGGKIMAESVLPGTTTFITMIPGGYKPEQGQSDRPPEVTPIPISLDDLKVTLKQFIEPEAGDVDITTENVLIAVGRGIQSEDNIELAEELAELMGGTVCASRPIVDQGWLPISRMVGKSGQSVKPKLYLALGISGAPEHVEGMADSEIVVAVNVDPGAPIFDIAKYGAEVDLFDLIDYLIEAIEGAV
jgi:electron transfer flavoprotein alpha subunit